MTVLRVLTLLVTAGVRNRVRAQFRRMKQPKYLIATLVGLSYFWFFFARHLFRESWQVPAGGRAILVLAATAIAVPLALSNWIFGRERAPLTFSEAEIQLLFPGPVSRRGLVLYKVARSLLLVFVSATVTTLLFGARLSGNGLYFLLGSWVALSTLSVHEMAASLTRRALILEGARGVTVLAVGVATVLGAVVASGIQSVRKLDLPPLAGLEPGAVIGLAGDLLESPLGWLLYPVRAPVEAALATEPSQFALAFAVALGVLGLHVVWVLRSDVAFEEASVEDAERRARRLEARKAGRRVAPAAGTRLRSMRLEVPGRPEWALVWKSVIATRRVHSGQLIGFVLSLVIMAAASGFLFGGTLGGVGFCGGFALASFGLAGLLTLFAPNALRADFRADLTNADILKSLPLSGTQVVVGELMGPLSLVTSAQWALLLLALVLSSVSPLPGFPLPVRLAIALSAALLAPFLTLGGFLVQNAIVLLFPGWAPSGVEQPRGFEATGLRLLTFVGSVVVWAVGLLPAVLVGGVVMFVVWSVIGPVGMPIAALAAAALLAVEAWFGIRFLGRVFDRWDVSAP